MKALRAAVLLALLPACGTETQLGAPRPAALSPAIGFTGNEVSVTITGTRFYVDPSASYVEGDASVESGFRAFLGTAELASVTRVDTETLEALVPPTMLPGAYDLTVVDSRGKSGTLAGAFQVLSCLVVTTDQDELAARESLVPPHEGDGLSLREALTLANELDAQSLCMGFSGPMTITLGTAALPTYTGPELALDATGVLLDGAAVTTSSAGLDLRSTAHVSGIRMRGFESSPGIAVRLEGAGSTLRSCELESNRIGVWLGGASSVVEGCLFTDHSAAGVRVRASDAVIRGSRFVDVSLLGAGVDVEAGGDRAGIFRSVFVRATTGVSMSSVADVRVDHDTFHDGGVGILAGSGVTGARVRNSIISDMSLQAIVADDTELAEVDYVTFTSNAGQPCGGDCTLGPNCDLQNPDFTDENADDLTLEPGSPCIDSALDLGIDVNGDAPGLFNGTAPDRGGLESP